MFICDDDEWYCGTYMYLHTLSKFYAGYNIQGIGGKVGIARIEVRYG